MAIRPRGRPIGRYPEPVRTFPVPKVWSALWSRAVEARLLDHSQDSDNSRTAASAPTRSRQTYGRRTRRPGGDRRTPEVLGLVKDNYTRIGSVSALCLR
jgi:hypothetical protein